FFSLILLLHPKSTLFPYTTLFRSIAVFGANTLTEILPHLIQKDLEKDSEKGIPDLKRKKLTQQPRTEIEYTKIEGKVDFADIKGDRKSTRLNSSHVSISYAVFCLK